MTETCRLHFQEPLDPMDELTIRLLTERYEGVDQPFQKFTSDGVVTLVLPRIIRPTFMRKKEVNAQPKSVEAPSLLPVPSNG